MLITKKQPRLTKKRAEKYKEQLSLQAIEIAGMAQSLIKRRRLEPSRSISLCLGNSSHELHTKAMFLPSVWR